MAKERRAEESRGFGGDVTEKVRQGVASAALGHQGLIDLMRVLLRPGEHARWSSLRRLLRLAGHPTTKSHTITLALLEAFPDAYLDRVYEGDQRPRVIRGVELAADMNVLRRMLAEKWEARLAGEGMPPELTRIAQEYKLSPLTANDNGHGGRLYHLVIRAHVRKQFASRYYGLAADYLWSMSGGWANWPGHKRIWELHCEGATKEEIAQETGLAETKVQSILDYHRARAGLIHR